MTDVEVETVMGWLAAGKTVRVPFHASLYPDETAHGSTLRRGGDGAYLLETALRQWQSVSADEPTQLTTDKLDEGAVRRKLRAASFASCSVA